MGHFEKTLAAITNRSATVGIVGLGYVGLPLVRILAQAGFQVLGFDVDSAKIEKLLSGTSYIRHIPDVQIRELLDTNRFDATSDLSRLGEADAILICVPTPLTSNRDPDMTYVEGTTKDIAATLRPGQLIVLESTTYPGTTRQLMLPILEDSGLKAGEDFFMAFSPEREDPGNQGHSAAHIPKVVGGLDAKSHALAVALYEPIVPKVVGVSSPEVAEACKILENTYRAVNIALVNELKILFSRMQIDVWEVIDAAKTKPFGFQAFYPGPGLGGHCIPIDPFYLSWIARQYGFNTHFIELAGEVNSAMPDYVVSQVMLALNSQKKAVRGAKIGLLGMAYKKNVDDPRESPSFELFEKLLNLGADVQYNDPFIPTLPSMRHYPWTHAAVVHSHPMTEAWLSSLDCVLIATDHDEYDATFIVDNSPLIVDTRNLTGKVTRGREKIWQS